MPQPLAHLRFRHARRESERLGFVPTPHALVARLLEHLPRGCQRIVDLGAGDGRLAGAALTRCPSARALLVEADQERARVLADTLDSRATLLVSDVLRDASFAGRLTAEGAADAVISNPPFLETQLAPGDLARLRDVFPFLPDAAGWVRADIAFLAQAWSITAAGSLLGFILPAPALTQAHYRPLRELLLTQLEGLIVSQLPSRVFPGVEVDAFLLTGVRAARRERAPTLRRLDGAGRILGEMQISVSAGMERLDFSAHAGAPTGAGQESVSGSDTLGSLGVHISRGSLPRTAFARAGIDAFHTTHFAAARGGVQLVAESPEHRMAEAGDILIPRVGSRCLTREARVTAGAGVFTDSVYRLRGAPEVMDRVWSTMASDFGRRWRSARAVGSCAKHLPLWVLQDMPVL